MYRPSACWGMSWTSAACRTARRRGSQDSSPSTRSTGTCSSTAASTALTFLLQQENRPNAPALRLLARGLSPKRTYRLSVRPAAVALTDFGSLVNMVSPVHIRPGSLAEKATGAVRLPGEREDLTASGDLLMKYGAWLKQGFSGTGYDGQTRVMGDCGSRLYVLEGQRAISPARPGRPGAARDTGRR